MQHSTALKKCSCLLQIYIKMTSAVDLLNVRFKYFLSTARSVPPPLGASYLGRSPTLLLHDTYGGGFPLAWQVKVTLLPRDTVLDCRVTGMLGGAVKMAEHHHVIHTTATEMSI